MSFRVDEASQRLGYSKTSLDLDPYLTPAVTKLVSTMRDDTVVSPRLKCSLDSFQHFNDFFGIEPLGIIDIHEGSPYLSVRSDDVGGGDRQLKSLIAITFGKINSKRGVDGPQVEWKLKNYPKLPCDTVPHVTEDFKSQFVLFRRG